MVDETTSQAEGATWWGEKLRGLGDVAYKQVRDKCM